MFVCSISSPGYDLVTNKKHRTIEADYLATFAWLKKQKVDIFLAAHGNAYNLEDKAAAIRKSRSPNPFVDPQGYKDFVAESEKSFQEKLKTQKAEKK